MVQPVQLLLN